MRERGLILLTVFATGALAVLIGLGVWQLQRLQWKEELIAEITARTTAPPTTLTDAVARASRGEDISYTRVRADGVFDHSKERYYFAGTNGSGVVGWHVITPLATPGGTVVLVDRGFVPDALKDPAKRPQGQSAGPITVTGLVHLPDKQGLFVPNNEVAQNRWFWRDLAAMTRSLYPSGSPPVAPFFLEAERSDIPGGWPLGGQSRIDLPNDHLQYAITWFGIALGLVVIYGLYVQSRLRGGPGADGHVAGSGPAS